MADQMYSMCWAPPRGSQYQGDDGHKRERYARKVTSGSAQETSGEEIDCVTMAADSLLPQESNCKTPGSCINGKPINLAHLAQHGLEVEVPSGMVLVGAKSPILGKVILVAAVDKRFLPGDSAVPTTLGFSGSCVGCGDPHFRYFTEFANHINLVLATQPKKQKHLKCYILRDNLGRLCRGPRIPWRETPRKRAFPYPSFQSMMEGKSRQMTSEVSSSSFTPPGVVNLNHKTMTLREGRSSTSSQSSCDSGSSFDTATAPLYKRSRDDLDVDGEVFPSHAWLQAVCGVRPVLVLGHPSQVPHFVSCCKEIVVSDMLKECFEYLNDATRTSSTSLQLINRPFHRHQSAHPTGGSFNHPDIRSDTSPSPSFTSPQLSLHVLVILMAQYLSQLSEDTSLSKAEFHDLIQNSKELFWQTYQECSTIQPFFLSVDSSNLIHFASLATLPSRGSVKLVSSVVSLSDAINKGLGFLYQISKHNQHRETKLQVPYYLLLVSIPSGKNPEFCVMVTGMNQAKSLQERLIGESHSVTSLELTDFITTLDQTYQMLTTTINSLIKQVEQTMTKSKLVFLPFNGYPTLKIPEAEAACMLPKVGASFQAPDIALRTPQQVSTAHHLLSCVLASKDGVPAFNLRHFSSVDFAIVIPPSVTYFNQMLHQVQKSDVLVELGLGPPTQSQDTGFIVEHIIQNNGSEESNLQLKNFLTNAKSCVDVLFVLVCEQAHSYFAPDVSTNLPYFNEILCLPNVLVVLSTPVPYQFQTCWSRIRQDNEVFWSDPVRIVGPLSQSDHKLLTSHASIMYFGMREYTESLSWTHQIPLIREDDEFEGMAQKANLLTTVPSNVIRSYLLIHHYTTAIMWSAGMRSIEPHCTFKTLQTIRDIIECPLRSSEGRGAMLIIRVPSAAVATWAYKKLKDTRDRVGFHYRFAVINDDEESGLHVEEHFLKRLRLWRNKKGSSSDVTSLNDWYPKRYEDLLDLPCIVLVSGQERTGDTFPRSLKYCDFRLLQEHCQHRSTLELEFNAVARYINSGLGSSSQDTSHGATDGKVTSVSPEGKPRNANFGEIEKTKMDSRNKFCSNYPLPVLLVSRTAYRILQTDFFGCPKHLRLSTDPSVEWNSDQRPALVSDLPSEQSKYYRRWTRPRDNSSHALKENISAEANQMKYYSRCFLFSGPPQVGKTSAVLHFIQLLYGTLLKLQRVDVYDEVQDSLTSCELIPSFEMDQPNYKILSKTPFNPSLVGTRFSCVSSLNTRMETDKTTKDMKLTNGDNDVCSDVISNQPPTSSVMMSSFAAYDCYHHCDECKHYREGLGPGLSSNYVITLASGDQLTFVIPSARREWFVFNERNELRTLKLPAITRKNTSDGWKFEIWHSERDMASKTPIFTPSSGRHEQGLLNLFHAMEGRDHIHLVFVKNNELPFYQKIWPNHVLVGLPPSCNLRGLGTAKDIMKEFAIQNLSAERKRQQCDNSNSVWPYVHIMDDSCVMWQNLTIDNSNNFQDDDRSKPGDWSLLQTTRLLESSPNVTSFALIGFNQWGTGNVTQYKLNSYSVCQVHSSLFLNIDVTRHVSYNRRLFSWEQVDFNLRLSSRGGVIMRYNHINVLKKRITVGGGRYFDVTSSIDDIISLPDRDPINLIPVPAHYLLEEYLRLKAAEKIFPAAAGNPTNPVLLLDCFVNLGRSIAVEFRSISATECEGPGSTQYGGILLYLCGGCNVTKEVLRDFRFCPGAKICVVSSDRSSLRDQVVKLDLEEHWRFRLRDEFKTASGLGDDALYFLTGTYDG